MAPGSAKHVELKRGLRTAATFVTHLKSANEASETAVKLIEDYHECVTNDEETRQQLLHVVEWHRRHMPLLTKKKQS